MVCSNARLLQYVHYSAVFTVFLPKGAGSCFCPVGLTGGSGAVPI
jgi:hypothetical protein